MRAPTTFPTTHARQADWSERRSRIKAALVDSGIGSTAALHAVLASVYRHAPETLAHATRVASLGVSIAGELDLSDLETADLERAALTHDLGRFAMPLGAGEAHDVRVAVEQLLAAGEILGAVPFLRPAACLVLASRECFDGSGYPSGLARTAIPAGARVLQVADAFDALSSVCLSLHLEREAADAEIVRNAGARFDPDVVAACLRCADRPPAGASLEEPC
ncbi:MAG: HD domain-containing protein [Acidobacteria bacterium]|nr:HD domain-containing protein [Acidobacteriota bacterium]